MDTMITTALDSAPMTRAEEGDAVRDEMLRDLRRRWDAGEGPPTTVELGRKVGLKPSGVQHHAAILREQKLIIPRVLWLTALGYRHASRL